MYVTKLYVTDFVMNDPCVDVCRWHVIGFTLTYGPDQGGVIGNFDHAFLINVAYDSCSPNAPTIPSAIFAMFQMMFAVPTSP